MKTLVSILFAVLLFVCTVRSQQASLQLVHCSADSALSKVDVWIDSIKILDDFNFRSSSAQLNIDTGTFMIISLCPSNSIDTSNSFYRDSFKLTNDKYFQVFVTGFVTSGYTPFHEINLSIFEVKAISVLSNYSEFAFFNGASDLGTIDILDITTNISQLVNNLDYSQLSDYNSLEAFNYFLRICEGSGTDIIRELEFFLGDQQLNDSAFTVVFTGFEDRSANLNGPSLGFHIVRSTGGLFIPLDNAFAQIQIIQNVPEKALSSLDFYFNGNLSVDNLQFRTSTGFINVASGRKFELAAAMNNSSTVADSLIRLETELVHGETYTYVLSGLQDQSIIPFKPLTFSEITTKKVASTGYNCDIVWVHGATDVDQVSVLETSQLGESIFSQSSFGQVSDYRTIPAANYQIKVQTDLEETVILSYSVPLSQLGGSAQTWVLSGISDTNTRDSSNRIGVFVATPSGGPLTELNTSTSIQAFSFDGLSIFPNPTAGLLQVQNLRESTNYDVYSLDGRLLQNGSINRNATIDISRLQNGIYYIQFSQGELIDSKRIVLTK